MQKQKKLLSNLILSLPWLLVLAYTFKVNVINQFEAQHLIGSDGYDYAIIAIHLLHHIGSAWSPEFSPTHFTHFYEHPPVGLWYFAIFYKIFGDQPTTDIIIAAFNFSCALIMIYFFWRREFPNTAKIFFWIPLLLFINNYFMMYYVVSNKFESIEMLLSLVLVYWFSQCRFHAISNKQLITQILIGSILCVIGLEINGLLILFVWATYFICKLTSSYLSWKQTIFTTVGLVIMTMAFLSLLLLLSPGALENNLMYLKTQLLPSIAGHRTDMSVLTGIKRFIPILLFIVYNVIPCLLIAIMTVLYLDFGCQKNNISTAPLYNKKYTSRLIFYMLLIAAAILPIIVSSKVLTYYTMHANPYVALLTCSFITPIIEAFYTKLHLRTWQFAGWCAAALIAGLVFQLQITSFSTIKNATLALADTKISKIIASHVKNNTIISIAPHFRLHDPTITEPPLQRLYNISLLGKYGCKYLLTSILDIYPIPKGYTRMHTKLNAYGLILYQRKNNLATCHPSPENPSDYYNFTSSYKVVI